jgi:hypothetical protein
MVMANSNVLTPFSSQTPSLLLLPPIARPFPLREDEEDEGRPRTSSRWKTSDCSSVPVRSEGNARVWRAERVRTRALAWVREGETMLMKPERMV